jgi:hypothetical protein
MRKGGLGMRAKLIVLVFLVIAPVIAQADLVIEEKIETSGFMDMWSSHGTETTYIKGQRIRNESEIETTGMMQGMMGEQAAPTVSIMRLDEGLLWFIDDAGSTYMEMSLKGEEVGGEVGELPLRVKDVKIKKTGETKTIAGYECAGIKAEMTFESGSEDETVSHSAETLLWMTSRTERLGEMQKMWEGMVELAGNAEGVFPMGDAMKELWDRVRELDGIPLGMEITMAIPVGEAEEDEEMKEALKAAQQYLKGLAGGEEDSEEVEAAGDQQMKIVREVTSIAEKTLDDTLFEIPKGYTRTKPPRPMMFEKQGR